MGFFTGLVPRAVRSVDWPVVGVLLGSCLVSGFLVVTIWDWLARLIAP